LRTYTGAFHGGGVLRALPRIEDEDFYPRIDSFTRCRSRQQGRDFLKEGNRIDRHGPSVEGFIKGLECLIAELHCKGIELDDIPQGLDVRTEFLEGVQKGVEVVDERVLSAEKCYPRLEGLFDCLLGMEPEHLIGEEIGIRHVSDGLEVFLC